MLGIKLIYSVVLLFSSIISCTISYPHFDEVIKENYDKYVVIESINDNYGELEIVYGRVNNNDSISFIYIPASQINPTIKVISNKTYTYSSKDDIIVGYGIRIKKIDEITFSIQSDEYEVVKKTYKIDDLEKLLDDGHLGSGKNDFPSDDRVKSKLPIYLIFFGIAFLLIVVFSVIATIVVNKYIKQFNEKYNKGETETYIFPNVVEIKEVEVVEEKETEAEITEEQLYEMYKKGEISYQEYLSKSRRFDED